MPVDGAEKTCHEIPELEEARQKREGGRVSWRRQDRQMNNRRKALTETVYTKCIPSSDARTHGGSGGMREGTANVEPSRVFCTFFLFC